ncbi:unnamed protein product, partial [Didymodactylos carnosus]
MQINIWQQSFEQFIEYPVSTDNGFQLSDNEVKIKWITKSTTPDDTGLLTCGRCSTGCKQCKCGKNGYLCTIYCRCSNQTCTNRSKTEQNSSFLLHSMTPKQLYAQSEISPVGTLDTHDSFMSDNEPDFDYEQYEDDDGAEEFDM